MKDFNFWKEELIAGKVLLENDDKEAITKLVQLVWPLGSNTSRGFAIIGSIKLDPSYARDDESLKNDWIQIYKEDLAYSLPKIQVSYLHNLLTSTSPETSIQLYPLT